MAKGITTVTVPPKAPAPRIATPVSTFTEGDVPLVEKNWIAGAIKNPGSLRKSLGAKPGKKIPAKKLAAAAKKGGKTGQRARLAQTLAKLRK